MEIRDTFGKSMNFRAAVDYFTAISSAAGKKNALPEQGARKTAGQPN